MPYASPKHGFVLGSSLRTITRTRSFPEEQVTVWSTAQAASYLGSFLVATLG